ncbi:MAG: hypothetical protein KGI09_07810 [Thaumarchaeota archaeon]|nr:hypothetical protein [Nitrososphaerota archaeon]
MRSRRAISSVVGMVFAIIALTTTITYISYSMGILNNYNQSVLTQNQQLTDVDKEKFQISSVTVPNGKLNVTIANTGSLPIQFTKLWIQNTSATDWVNSYVPTNSFVSPGGVLTNVGQNIPVSINPANSYNVKMVTSRGNTQQFMVNSANIAPLNIQLLAVPNNVDVGFNSSLIMVVTNNGSSILTNIAPTTPTQTAGIAGCQLGKVTPSTYPTLQPGSTAIFKWDVIVSSGTNGTSCTFTATPPIQNGYPSQRVSAKVTVTYITFTQTLLSKNTGILTLDYTSFRWTEGDGQWHTGWAPPGGNYIAFTVNMTNNNETQTNPPTNFYVGHNTLLFLTNTKGASSTSFFIMNSVNRTDLTKSVGYSCNGSPTNNYCISIPSGKTVPLYFQASSIGNSDQGTKLPSQGSELALSIVIFGQYTTSQSGSGSLYGQNLPYIGLETQ